VADLPTLAGLSDLVARCGPIDDTPRALAALADASALIRDEAGIDWEDGAPPLILAICCACALRALRNPGGYASESEGIDGYLHTVAFGASGSGVWLTSSERRSIKRIAGQSVLGSVAYETPNVFDGVTYVATSDGGTIPGWINDGLSGWPE
jgi:hypothetical protein